MNGIWLASHMAQWLIILLLLVSVLTLARQIGLLHKRVSTLGAGTVRGEGPKIGDAAPIAEAIDFGGRPVTLGGRSARRRLIAFLSPTCSACVDLVPALKAVWAREKDALDLIVVDIGGDESASENYVLEHELERIPYITSVALGRTFQVKGPPFVLLLDEEGNVRAKGTANHLEHLEILFSRYREGSSVAKRVDAGLDIAASGPKAKEKRRPTLPAPTADSGRSA